MALIGEMRYLQIGGNTYEIPTSELPIASSSTLGGIKVGSGLTIDSSTGVLSATGTSITIDTAMSDSSTNTVQNKVIKSYVDTNIPTKVSDLQNDSGFTTNTGTVTSVRVQASSPLSSSTSTAQSTSLNTTISFSKQNKNLVLAGPSSGSSAAAPSFRSLVADDIPDLSSIYLTSFTETDPVFSASAAAGITATDITNWNSKISDTGKWNDVSLNKTISDLSNQEAVIPFLWNSSDTVARFAKVSKVPSNNCIAQYNNGYLNSTTPDASDSSTKVATTAWVTGKGYLTSYTETDPTVPSWAKASTKPTYTASEVGAVATSAVGAASGVAPLNASSKIDSAYLPSYVDDIIEGYYYNSKFWKEAAHTTEITGEAGKIYVDLSTDKTYRYSGTGYVEVSSGSLVTVTRSLTSGTKSATINIDGTDYDIYSEKNTDTKATQIPLNGTNSSKGLLFSNSTGAVQTTNTVYTSDKIQYNDYNQTLYIFNSDGTKMGYHKFDLLALANSTTSYQGRLKTANVTANRTYTLPDATGTIALTTDIPTVSITQNLTSGTKSATINVNGTDYDIYSETNTDTKVTQTPLGGFNSLRGLLFSNTNGSAQSTDIVYTSNKIIYNDYDQTLRIYNSNRTKYSYFRYDTLSLANSANSYTGTLRVDSITASRTYTLPDATGTIALTSDIPTIPVTSVNGQTGAVTIAVPTASSTTPAMDGTAAIGSETTFARGDHVHPTDTSRAASTAVTTQATIDNTGLITYKNSGDSSLYTVQLPLFDGGSGASNLPFLPLAGGSLTGNLSIGGTTTSTKLLTANGGISTTTLTTSGNTVVGGTLGVTGATTLSSTLEVTGATTLGSTLEVTGGGTFGGAIDVVPRRCYANLSQEGWYRIMAYSGTVNGSKFATSCKIDICINTQYNATNNAMHKISLVGVFQYADFVDEVSYSNTNVVDKIRYSYDENGHGYIDIHYAENSANYIGVVFDVQAYPPVRGLYNAVNFDSVVPSPSGETVMAEYEFITTTYGGMRYYRESISDITLSSAGFKTMTMPARIVGHKIVSIMISNCSTISGGAIIPLSYTDGSGTARSSYYMAGSPGASMTNAVIEFWYL